MCPVYVQAILDSAAVNMYELRFLRGVQRDIE